MMTNGCPLEVTRVVPTLHTPVTHGPGAGGTSGHPATTHGAASVAVGCPLTMTRGFGTVGIACPPCEQVTVAPRWSKKPGMGGKD